MIQLTSLYHDIIKNKKDIHIAVDMTCGHGYDTYFLAQHAEKVYGFDVQDVAINETKYRLKDFDNIQIIRDDHQNIKQYITNKIDVAVFNLGYMPGGDFSIATEADSTLNALKSLISMLAENGLIILELYPHNPNEIKSVIDYSKKLNSKIDVIKVELINKNNAPTLLIIKNN